MSNKKFSILTATLALLVFYLIFNNHQPASTQPSSPILSTSKSKPPASFSPSISLLPTPSFVVTRVIDGDTIQIDTGQKVRYIGVNTPETVDPRRPVQCFGKEASAYNKNLVLNKKVKLVKDISEKDKYGRLLRYVYLEDGTFVNLKLVSDGYAHADTFPPDVAHADDFVKAQQQAREAGLGLWGKCK